MVDYHPSQLISVDLTSKEKETILSNCNIHKTIYDKIFHSTGTIDFLIEETYELSDSIFLAIERTTNNEVKDILGVIFNKLAPNPEIRTIAEEISNCDFDSIDDINEHLHGIMTQRNDSPDPEMGGLSPDQVNRLIYSNWDDDRFPIKFNKELTIDDIKNSSFFHNARLLLNILVQMEKENTATNKGNLTRSVVKAVFDKIIIPESERNFILNYNKVINELDVRHLHHIRVVCESTGIIKMQKKKFLVKKKYLELLEDKNAGKLFYLLFFGYFRKFNIGSVDGSPDFNCIQDTIPYSFYRLSKIGKKRIDVNKLKKQLFLPAVLNKLRDGSKYNYDIVDDITWLVESRIVEPLELFGLLECSYKEKFKNYVVMDKVKKSKLFDKFVVVKW